MGFFFGGNDANKPKSSANPILVEVRRGELTENVHRGAVAIVRGKGKLIYSIGDIKRLVFLRSACKPLQTLPLIETGAAAKLNLDNKEIALACSSHSGEEVHTKVVEMWLKKLALKSEDLECGADEPIDAETAKKLYCLQKKPSPIYNCCSGKHLGILSTCIHLGISTKNYSKPEHAVQKMIAATLGEFAGCDIKNRIYGIEGCGIPTYAFSLYEAATAFAKFSTPSSFKMQRASAINTITNAMLNEPYMVAGKGRFDTDFIEVMDNILVKSGSEGVMGAYLLEHGVGIAVKVDDGSLLAARVAILAIIDKLGLLDDDKKAKLAKWIAPEVLDKRGESVGKRVVNQKWVSKIKKL